MARTCDACKRLIEQKDDEFLELQLRVLAADGGDTQDPKAQAYGDFCDACIRGGKALETLLAQVEWKFEASS